MNKILKTAMVVAAIALPLQIRATVLTFDYPGAVNGTPIPQTYGDNVAALDPQYGSGGGLTPNITVSYAAYQNNDLTGLVGTDAFWSTGYGDLTGVSYGNPNGYYASFTLTPAAGYSVTLESFDFAGYLPNAGGYPGQSGVNELVRIFDGAALVYDVSPTLFPFVGHDSLTPMITSANSITILFGADWNGAIDNIQFSQPGQTPTTPGVPDGGLTLALLGMSITGLGLMRRKLS